MSLLTKWLQLLISLKGVVLISALLLLAGYVKPAYFSTLDHGFFQLAQGLSSPLQSKSDIALIAVDEEDLLRLQQDPAQSVLLPLLLARDPIITLLLPRAVRENTISSERVLQRLDSGQESNAAKSVAHWQHQFQQQSQLQERLRQGEILVGLTQAGVSSFPEQAYPLVAVDSIDWHDISWLPTPVVHFLQQWLQSSNALKVPLWPVDPGLQGSAYRAADVSEPGLSRQLIWLQESQFHADVALALYWRQLAQTLNIEEEPAVSFRSGYAVEMAHRTFPMSQAGSIVVPLFSAESFSQYTLAQALASPPAESIWLLSSSTPQMVSVAATLQALESSHYYYQPFWSHWLQAVLVLLGVLYLCWLQPLLRGAVAVLMALFFVTALAVVQVAWQLSYQQILPLPIVMVWFAAGSLLMLIWRQRTLSTRRLQWELHNTSYQLAQQWYQQGRMEEAITALRPCYSTESVLSLMYDIAVQQERKRQYQDAAKTYDGVVLRKPKFKDAQKRAQALLQLSEPAQVVSDFSATHSLVLPSQDLNNPILGRYEIERELGRGAMGVVYLGLDPKISRRVAIKTLNFRAFDSAQLDVIKERFFREAEAAGRLNHPNIVTVYDVGEEADLAFIAMDYVEGKSLDRCVSESTLLSVVEVYEVVAAVADALHYAHQQNIVHRDIKPGNIMYDQNSGQIKVADFGIARIVDDSKTKTGDMLGSPVYMSPEQLKGMKVSGSSDIYSLGVTFYQLLTGALPFTGDSIANLAYHILNKKYKSVREVRPELSAGVVRIINKALHKEPSKRYDNAAAMADAIRGLLSREFGRREFGRKAS
jgi:tRNA A-37 threonylcarbamoyl transferase component Bud32